MSDLTDNDLQAPTVDLDTFDEPKAPAKKAAKKKTPAKKGRLTGKKIDVQNVPKKKEAGKKKPAPVKKAAKKAPAKKAPAKPVKPVKKAAAPKAGTKPGTGRKGINKHNFRGLNLDAATNKKLQDKLDKEGTTWTKFAKKHIEKYISK